jgi:hypothetical protein
MRVSRLSCSLANRNCESLRISTVLSPLCSQLKPQGPGSRGNGVPSHLGRQSDRADNRIVYSARTVDLDRGALGVLNGACR